MFSALVTQVIDNVRRSCQQCIRAGFLRIQHAQRVALQSFAIHRRESVIAHLQVFHELLDIGWLTDRATGTIDLETQPFRTQGSGQALCQQQNFQVGQGVLCADNLNIELLVLAISSLLRFFVTKDRTKRVQLYRRRQDIPMLIYQLAPLRSTFRFR